MTAMSQWGAWVWNQLACENCGKRTYRPPHSTRPCSCGGDLRRTA